VFGLKGAILVMEENELLPGMNLYCDLWCERCPAAGHCVSHSIVHRADASSPEGFMERQTQSILQMQMDFAGIAYEFKVRVEMADFFRITEVKSRLLSNTHIRRLIRRGRDFGRLVSSFLGEGNSGRFPRREQEILADLIDEIIWFKIQIQFRLVLAGILRIWETGNPGLETDPCLRSDGFAKSVLVSTKRFETALNRLNMYQWGPATKTRRLLAEVHQIRDELVRIYPKCPQYVRPGLDELLGMPVATGQDDLVMVN